MEMTEQDEEAEAVVTALTSIKVPCPFCGYFFLVPRDKETFVRCEGCKFLMWFER